LSLVDYACEAIIIGSIELAEFLIVAHQAGRCVIAIFIIRLLVLAVFVVVIVVLELDGLRRAAIHHVLNYRQAIGILRVSRRVT